MIEISQKAKGLIFDLDGTIANTMQLHFESWRKAVVPYGVDFNQELFMKLTGTPQIATIEILNDMFGVKMNPVEVGIVKSTHYKSLVHLTEEIPVIANVIRKYHNILPMSVGTGSSTRGAKNTLEIIGMNKYFDIVITADDVEKFKPHPETFLKCAQLMGVNPKECIVFEDGILGIQAAEEAGMMVVDVNDYFKMDFTI